MPVWMLVLIGAAPGGAPEELGIVDWSRGYDAALARAGDLDKPLLVLFDEVPGCSTVKAFGNGALSHPMVADAAETLFVPLVVYNNVGGDDRRVLQAFGEPAWNNPVVRIVDATGAPLVARHAGDISTEGLARTLVDALRASGDGVPLWLSLLADRPAVEMRPRRVQASPDDDLHTLSRTAWRHVPMTALQATQADSWLRQHRDPGPLFSPRQHALHDRIVADPGAGWATHLGRGDLVAAWRSAVAVAGHDAPRVSLPGGPSPGAPGSP